jgi:hypothetical protein
MRAALTMAAVTASLIILCFYYPIVSSRTVKLLSEDMELLKKPTCDVRLLKSAVVILDKQGLNDYERYCQLDLLENLSISGFRKLEDGSLLIPSDFSYHLVRLATAGRDRCEIPSAYCYMLLAIDLELYDIKIRRSRASGDAPLIKEISEGF